MVTDLLILSLLLLNLFALFTLKCFSCAQRRLWHRQTDQLQSNFFYLPLQRWFFSSFTDEEEVLILHLQLSFYRTTLGPLFLLLLFDQPLYFAFSTAIALWLIAFLLSEYAGRYSAYMAPEKWLQRLSLPAAFFLLPALPFAPFLLLLMRKVLGEGYIKPFIEGEMLPYGQLAEIVEEEKEEEPLDRNEQKLLTSVLRFSSHIAREVMVPRVDLFALEASTPIRIAAAELFEEGYSRIPLYRDTIDEIVGVLMYKDLLERFNLYAKEKDEATLDAPVESIAKPAFYTPETKKIGNLLQEFRSKQVHIAIVVDEYGGTEGVVTIEDILEQIVGEIADEYDVDEEILFRPAQEGKGWLVDARMSILDLEQQLAISLPQEGEYDTVGGYLFHCAGTIPQRGFTVQSDEVTLRVERSNERCVELVRITPLESQ